MTIAFLGLGAMGARMARRLLDAGHDLVVYNRTASRCDDLVLAGARAATTPADAARDADVVWSMLTDDDAARAVWLSPATGATLTLQPGALAIASGTVTPGWITELAAAVRGRGAVLIEAPVVGTRPHADQGILTVLAGGAATDIAAAQPLLDHVATAVHHAGDHGAGARLKLAVNALFATQVAALAELLGALAAQGIQPSTCLPILNQLAITSPAAKAAGAAMSAGAHDPLFPIDLVAKDLRYAVDTAAAAGIDLPVVTEVRDAFAAASAEDLGARNLTAIAQRYRRA